MTEISRQTGFDKLLAVFDADREQAGVKYENLRRRLMGFFEWRGCENPADLADIVLDRVARKIEDGENVENINAYSAGIARFVFKEYLRSNQKHNQLNEDDPEITNMKRPEADEIQNVRADCLEKCLKRFSEEDRRVIVAYYDTDERTMIRTRKRLADEVGISLNNLRIRVCRLKGKLHDCTIGCCKQNG